MNTTTQPTQQHLLNFSYEELLDQLATFPGFTTYRLNQICNWIFARNAASFDQMTDLPLNLRTSLNEKFAVHKLRTDNIGSSKIDSTLKFNFKTDQNQDISSVFLPHLKYQSICISSQVGCAWKCQFCASGLVPYERNLTSGEILDQILITEETTKKKIQNVLFMGMGEPLGNWDGTLRALRWMLAKKGRAMSPSRITLSTTGVAPQIRKLANEELKINLALSLHAPNDELRKKIMPVSSKFLLADVLDACKLFEAKNDSDFTIEYILLKNVNDHLYEAAELTHVLKSMHFKRMPKINLIPYNPVPELHFQKPEPGKVEKFFEYLKKQDLNVHQRKPQGQDIGAACGQLS